MIEKLKKTNKLFLIAMFIIVLMTILVIFSPFETIDFQNQFSKVCYAVSIILIPFLFFVGYFIKKNKLFSLDKLVLVIGGVTALCVFVSTVATWINYGFFHTLRFRNQPVYYYDGTRYDVTQEAMMWTLLNFKEVSLNYLCNLALIPASLLPVSFILFKDQKDKKFDLILSLIFGAVGLLPILTLPNIPALIVILLGTIVAVLLHKFKSNKTFIKVSKITIYILFSVAVVFYLLAFINVALGYPFQGFLSSIFVDNFLMKDVTKVFEAFISKDEGRALNLFGFNLIKGTNDKAFDAAILNTGIFEIELVKEIGLGAFLGLIFIGLSLVNINECFINKKDEFSKSFIIIILVSFFVFNSLFFDNNPYLHNPSYLKFFNIEFIPFLIVVFFLGTTFAENKEDIVNE